MKVEFGKPLEQPITQTLLPVVSTLYGAASVVGYVPIVSTEYNDGSISQVTIGGISYSIGSVTMPHGITNPGLPVQPRQFVAVLFDLEQSRTQPWIGIEGFIPNDRAQFSSHWCAPADGARNNWNFGPLVGSLVLGMDRYVTSPEDGTPTEPGVDATAALNWTATLDRGASRACSFFDFNWFQLFHAEVTAGNLPRETVPLSISYVQQPASGHFVASTVQIPVLLPEFGRVYNTIRIQRMNTDIPLGDHQFVFQIKHVVNGIIGTKDVNFTLTLQ